MRCKLYDSLELAGISYCNFLGILGDVDLVDPVIATSQMA
jgi:hypothetical protein